MIEHRLYLITIWYEPNCYLSFIDQINTFFLNLNSRLLFLNIINMIENKRLKENNDRFLLYHIFKLLYHYFDLELIEAFECTFQERNVFL
jgi:hypothetical protein